MDKKQIDEQIEAIKKHGQWLAQQPKEYVQEYVKYLFGERKTCPEPDKHESPTEQEPVSNPMIREHVQSVIDEWIDKKYWKDEVRTKIVDHIMAGISNPMKDERVWCHIHNIECIETETEFYCPECALINTLKGKVSPHANKYKKHGTS